MEEHLIHYLTLISKLSDILEYINNNFEENDLSSYIKECKSLCIDKVKSSPLITLFLKEIQEENSELQSKKQKVQINEDKQISDTINNLSMLMQPDTNTNNISPEMFDSLGSGLIKLLRPLPVQEAPKPTIVPQIKNELNTVNTNINFEIKKKI